MYIHTHCIICVFYIYVNVTCHVNFPQYAAILSIIIILVLTGAILGYVKRDDVSHVVFHNHILYSSKFPWSNIFVIFVNFTRITKIFVTKFS